MSDNFLGESSLRAETIASSVNNMVGMDLVDLDGDTFGKCQLVYRRGMEGAPEWCAASVGFLDKDLIAVPLVDATVEGDRILVPYPRDLIDDAPRTGSGDITLEQEMNWYRHYNIRRELSGSTDTAVPAAPSLETWPQATGQDLAEFAAVTHEQPEVTEEQIRERAYEIYLERGGQDGLHEDDWRKAEAELRGRPLV
jgi:hypothetical protein